MAQCVQSVQEFVQDSFVPMVAVLCSEEAERVTRKNNLNFAELLRPFCRLTSEGKHGSLHPTRSLVCPPHSCPTPGVTEAARGASLTGTGVSSALTAG